MIEPQNRGIQFLIDSQNRGIQFLIVDLNPKTEGHNFDGFPKQRDKISLAQLHTDFFGAVGSDLYNLSADLMQTSLQI